MLFLHYAPIIRSKSKDGLAQSHDNVSNWNDVSTCWLLFQCTSTVKIQLSNVLLVQITYRHVVKSNLLSSHRDIAKTITHLA
jgi:hypothetical protein